MNDPSPSRRRFRLQISLRVLLLLMLLVGVGLTIFRWPWVETTQQEVVDPFAGPFDKFPNQATVIEERITLRRNWRGKPIRNGLSQRFIDGQLDGEEHYYDGEMQGPKKWFVEGKVTREQYFRQGKAHGPSRIGDGETWVTQENFVNGFRHGSAQYLRDRDFGNHFNFDSDLNGYRQSRPAVVQLIRGQWQRNERHGKWIWTTEGSVTHTEEFERDEIVRWDDKPIVEDFWRWLREQNDPQLLNECTEANQTDWYYFFRELPYFQVNEKRFIVHLEVGQADHLWEPQSLRGRLVPGICEFAARNQLAFAYRYAGLWLVPEGERDQPFVDPTGVSQIEFAAGTPQAAAWNEVVQVPVEVGYAAQCVALLLDTTPIEYRCENVSKGNRQVIGGGPPPVLFTRRRRDVLGYVLYQTGCRCELEGEPGKQVLRIVPRAERTQEQEEATPLSFD